MPGDGGGHGEPLQQAEYDALQRYKDEPGAPAERAGRVASAATGSYIRRWMTEEETAAGRRLTTRGSDTKITLRRLNEQGESRLRQPGHTSDGGLRKLDGATSGVRRSGSDT